MQAKSIVLAGILLTAVTLQGCKHPLAIVGEGDIVEVGNSGRGCTLEQFRAGDSACTYNEVSGDYFVNYKAKPRPGWRFVRWEGPCPADSRFQYCRFHVSKDAVSWWDETYPNNAIPPTTAVFQPIEGETGYLMAGTPVAGVTYETPTQQGVTGRDGSFQYEAGETVRFRIGDTLLGTVQGKAQVTPFDLAGSQVLTGIQVSWAVDQSSPFPQQAFGWDTFDPFYDPFYDPVAPFERPDPFHAVINTTVLLHSLDEDANPANGVAIKPGVAGLFLGVSLELLQDWHDFLGNVESPACNGQFPTLGCQLQRANKKHLFSAARASARPAPALQQVYETLEIDSRTYAPCVVFGFERVDSDMSCQFDTKGNLTRRSRNSDEPPDVEYYEYDSHGNLTRQESYTGDALQGFESWQYNTLGKTTRYSATNAEGVTRVISSWKYDKLGNLTRSQFDRNGDGKIDYAENWAYNSDNYPVRAEAIYSFDTYDLLDNLKTWQYHPNGTLSQYEEIAHPAEPHVRQVESWQYDARGRLTRHYGESRDSKGTKSTGIETREYDAAGNITRTTYIGEGNKPPPIRASERYEFDGEGRLVRFTQNENPPENGMHDRVDRWQYDDQGRVVRYESGDRAGEVDGVETWQYDAQGKPLRTELRETGGRAYTRNWQYDTSDRLTRYEEDTNVDGVADSVQTWQYNASGNLVRHETNQGDGQIYFENWLYDADGNLTSFESNNVWPPGQIVRWQFQTTGWGHLFAN